MGHNANVVAGEIGPRAEMERDARAADGQRARRGQDLPFGMSPSQLLVLTPPHAFMELYAIFTK